MHAYTCTHTNVLAMLGQLLDDCAIFPVMHNVQLLFDNSTHSCQFSHPGLVYNHSGGYLDFFLAIFSIFQPSYCRYQFFVPFFMPYQI